MPASVVVAENRLLLVALGFIVVANLLPADLMEFNRPAILGGQLWRLWTGQFCHWSTLHLAGNLAAIAGLALVAGKPICRWLVLLPVAAPLLSLFLLATTPEMEHYRGLSGLVAMLVVGASLEGGTIGWILAIAWIGKLTFDIFSGTPSPLLPDGIVTSWQSHVGGLLLGLLAAAGFRLRDTRKPSRP
ncbi:MAG: rhombosortase [Zoogloea sp.]|nr:rhombosortase [Zoogloea sp.]